MGFEPNDAASCAALGGPEIKKMCGLRAKKPLGPVSRRDGLAPR
jgi:hypothetical protein